MDSKTMMMTISIKNILFKLVVLTNNYSPDYAPFTVDKKGSLQKVPVQIRVGLKTLIFHIIVKIFSYPIILQLFFLLFSD